MLSVSALSMQDLKFGDLVLPADTKYERRGMDMELLWLLDVPAVQRSGLAPTEERCESDGIVDLELCGESLVVLVLHPSAKPSK